MVGGRRNREWGMGNARDDDASLVSACKKYKDTFDLLI